MKIVKYKKIGKSKYKVFFEKTDMIIYEDVILKYNLLSLKDIDLKLLDNISKENKYYEAYERAISYLSIKLRSKKELKKYLNRFDFSVSIINKVIKDLELNGYLSDEKYVSAYIHDKVYLTNDGPLKIERDLINMEFNEEIVKKYLNEIDEKIWINKINKIISKKNNTTSNYLYKLKLQNDLYMKGYTKELTDQILVNLEENEDDNLIKDIEKAKKRYSSKYKGKELNNKIITFLASKGYSYESINRCL